MYDFFHSFGFYFLLFVLLAGTAMHFVRRRDRKLQAAHEAEKARQAAEAYVKFKEELKAYPGRYREAVAFCGADAEEEGVQSKLRGAVYNYTHAVDYDRVGDQHNAKESLKSAVWSIKGAMQRTESIRCLRDAQLSLQPPNQAD